MKKVPLVIYTHSDYSFLYNAVIGQINKYVNDIDIHICYNENATIDIINNFPLNWIKHTYTDGIVWSQRVYKCLTEIKNLDLIEPLIYSDLLLFINSCSLILSDSGGIQEEACILGKKIIILREHTERPEVVKEGLGILVGSDQEKICNFFVIKHLHISWGPEKSISNKIFFRILDPLLGGGLKNGGGS